MLVAKTGDILNIDSFTKTPYNLSRECKQKMTPL